MSERTKQKEAFNCSSVMVSGPEKPITAVPTEEKLIFRLCFRRIYLGRPITKLISVINKGVTIEYYYGLQSPRISHLSLFRLPPVGLNSKVAVNCWVVSSKLLTHLMPNYCKRWDSNQANRVGSRKIPIRWNNVATQVMRQHQNITDVYLKYAAQFYFKAPFMRRSPDVKNESAVSLCKGAKKDLSAWKGMYLSL